MSELRKTMLWSAGTLAVCTLVLWSVLGFPGAVQAISAVRSAATTVTGILLLWVFAALVLGGTGYRLRAKKQVLAVLVGAGILWASAFLIVFPPAEVATYGKIEGFQLATAIAEARRSWALILGGLLALAGLAIALWRARIAEQGQITERFTRAVDQLGKLNEGDHTPHVVIRLGGIYALERIARDSKGDQGQVMEVLCAYVRESAPTAGRHRQTPREDVQAALTVIGRRNKFNDPTYLRINLSGSQLNGAMMRRCEFEGADFQRAQLEHVDFGGANLNRANFSHARLQNGRFYETALEQAAFFDAQLQEAYFAQANLQGAAFGGAELEHAQFTWAQIQGGNFVNARLTDAIFSYTQLQRADFTGAKLIGVDFSEAQLHGSHFWRSDLHGTKRLTQKQILSANFDQSTVFPDGRAGCTRDEVEKWTDTECREAGLYVPGKKKVDYTP